MINKKKNLNVDWTNFFDNPIVVGRQVDSIHYFIFLIF